MESTCTFVLARKGLILAVDPKQALLVSQGAALHELSHGRGRRVVGVKIRLVDRTRHMIPRHFYRQASIHTHTHPPLRRQRDFCRRGR